MIDSELSLAMGQNHFGYGRLDADLRVTERAGALLDILPPPGEKIFAAPLFSALESEFAALRGTNAERFEIPVAPGAPFDSPSFSISVLYDPRRDGFIMVAHVGSEWPAAPYGRETEARERASLYRDIVEMSGDIVFRLDAELRFTFVNHHACSLLLMPESAILGCEADRILGDASPGESWRASLAPGGESSFEQALRIPGRETLWIWWRVNWIGARRGFDEYQAVGRDIGDLRRLRAEAAHGAEEARRHAVMHERLRIAHDLHDTLIQSLVALAPQIRLIRKVAGPDADPRLIDELARAEQAVHDGLARGRAALTDLRAAKDEYSPGLVTALETLVDRFVDRTGIDVRMDIDQCAGAAKGERAEAFYRICEEAFRNIEWHASAHRVRLTLSIEDSGTQTLVIDDDGIGFMPERIKPGHFGLIGMREKAESIGALFTLETAPGKGVRIEIAAPPPRSK